MKGFVRRKPSRKPFPERLPRERAAAMYTLTGTAKLNDVDPQAWLADVPDRVADMPQTRLHELLPWRWKAGRYQAIAA